MGVGREDRRGIKKREHTQKGRESRPTIINRKHDNRQYHRSIQPTNNAHTRTRAHTHIRVWEFRFNVYLHKEKLYRYTFVTVIMTFVSRHLQPSWFCHASTYRCDGVLPFRSHREQILQKSHQTWLLQVQTQQRQNA